MTDTDPLSVRALAYLGFSVADPEAWTAFATDVLGAMPAAEGDGAHRLRVDQRAWRIAVEEGPENDLTFAGFEVANDAELEAMSRHLAAQGAAVEADDGTLAAERGVTRLIRCRDPIGIGVEIFYGQSERFEQPFVSPQAVSGFVTGDQGLGHIVLGTDDIDGLRRFYVDGLGFRRSDLIRMPIPGHGEVQLEFYHCNPRHHTLALMPIKGDRRIRHFMLQAETIDDVGFALDRAQGAGAKISATLGRHTNDHMISFYALTPAGFEVEFGYGARTVDDETWVDALHHRPSIWGHKRS